MKEKEIASCSVSGNTQSRMSLRFLVWTAGWTPVPLPEMGYIKKAGRKPRKE